MDNVIRKRGRKPSGVVSRVYYRRVPEEKYGEVHLAVEGVLLGSAANDKVGDPHRGLIGHKVNLDGKVGVICEYKGGSGPVGGEWEKSPREKEMELELDRLVGENAMLKAENERLIAGGVGVDVKMRGELERCKAKVKEYERMYNGS